MAEGVLIIGGSVGGVNTARSLRHAGYAGAIRLVEAESHPPYDKPPLSKQGLEESGEPRVPLLSTAETDELRTDLKLGVRAESLDLANSVVTLNDGSSLAFDELVIATGSSARPSPWGPSDRIHVLRSLDDAVKLRQQLDECQRALVVGASFIGSEFAAVARARGIEVTMVDPVPLPMARIVGESLGARFVELQRDWGVNLQLSVGVESIEETPQGLVATLTDGSVHEVDLAVVGIGAEPNTSWLDSSGLLIENGVVCDEFSRALSSTNVHVVGDVARWFHRRHGTTVRLEHWTNAVEQASCVAHNIVHPEAPKSYEPVEYVWSDQYDWKIQIVGRPEPATEPVILEQEGPFRLAAFWASADGALIGSLTVNWSKASLLARRALAAAGGVAPVVDALAPAPEAAL